MISESSIQIPLDGWVPAPDRPHVWTSDEGDQLSLHYFGLPPDLPSAISDMTRIREFYRKMLGVGGAIVEVEAASLGKWSGLRTIVKVRQKPSGMTYIAALTVPFAECSFVAKVTCPETGVTGARDTAVALKLNMVGFDNWFADPYLPRYRNPVLRNLSDDAEWDAMFPNHPLSRARRHLEAMSGMSLSSEVETLARFVGPPRRRSLVRRIFG